MIEDARVRYSQNNKGSHEWVRPAEVTFVWPTLLPLQRFHQHDEYNIHSPGCNLLLPSVGRFLEFFSKTLRFLLVAKRNQNWKEKKYILTDSGYLEKIKIEK
jgi:hypothetical protein